MVRASEAVIVDRRRLVRRLVGWAGKFAADRRGVSALEFALILPVMLVLYFGSVELGDALSINRKVTHITSSLSDLVTQSKTITNTDMDNILDAAESIIIPYDVGTLKMTVSGISIDAQGIATVAWSDTRNGTALTAGSTYSGLPDGVNQASTFLVTAQVSYDYTPTIGYILTGTYTLQDQFYLRPRASSTVTRQ